MRNLIPLFLLVFCSCQQQVPVPYPVQPTLPPHVDEPVFIPNTVSNEIYALHNEIRKEQKKQELAPNLLLFQVAQLHAEWMAANNTMSHRGENRSSFATRITNSGYKLSSGGENIAWGYSSPKDVMNGWMNSRGHRTNILGNWSEIGCGVSNKNGEAYWCVVFANPEESELTFLPAPLIGSVGKTGSSDPKTE